MPANIDSEAFLNHLQAAVEQASDRRGFNCPICTSGEWTVIDGSATLDLEANDIGSVHTVPVICDNCGFLAQFAVGQDDVE